jgi:hypothetical protein
MTATGVSEPLSATDFTDLDNFADGFPHDLFALHRHLAPVSWHQPTEHALDGEGFWSVASNAVAGGLLALAEHRQQFRRLRSDSQLLPTARKEMVRWASPSPSKRRTATCDVMLGGQSIGPGQKVQLWEGSANRDPDVFDRADESDIARKPNPHLGSAKACTTASAPTSLGWSYGC